MEPRFTRHLRDQLAEDHYQLELLLRAVKVVQAHLYEVEAVVASVRSELDDFAVYFDGLNGRQHDAQAVREHDRDRRDQRQSADGRRWRAGRR